MCCKKNYGRILNHNHWCNLFSVNQTWRAPCLYLAADEDVGDLEEEDERLGVLVPPARPEGEETLLLQLLLRLLYRHTKTWDKEHWGGGGWQRALRGVGVIKSTEGGGGRGELDKGETHILVRAAKRFKKQKFFTKYRYTGTIRFCVFEFL